MTWEEVVVPALRDGSLVSTSVRFSTGDACVVDVRMDHGAGATGEDSDLFGALVAARRVLEADGVLLACNGCRRDVYPSPMLRQSAGGRRAYVLTMPRSEVKPPTVDIFEPAPDVSVVVTVDEQRAWFDHWRPNNPGKDGGSEAVDPSAALIAAARTKPGGWVYEVVGEFGPDDAVPPTSIRGAWKVDDDGEIVGDFLPNPVFEPDGTNGRDC